MKIIVLHGDDTVKSYERLKKFIDTARGRSWEVSFLDESTSPLTENLSAVSLFGAERFFILRDVKRLGKKELTWLNKKYKELAGNFIIYSETALNQTFLKSLPEPKIEEFKLPKILWSFLELLHPGAGASSVRQFHKVIETEPPEFIFSLLARQFRDLYWVKTDPTSSGFPSWRIGKLKNQASRFTEQKLKELIGQMSEIDIKVKTSKADLISELDLLILKQLE